MNIFSPENIKLVEFSVVKSLRTKRHMLFFKYLGNEYLRSNLKAVKRHLFHQNSNLPLQNLFEDKAMV